MFVKEENTNFIHLNNNANVKSMENLIINDFDALKRLDKIDINTSPGPDGIHPRFQHEVRNEIASALRIIFNNSLQNHQAPLDWRVCNISPIFKKGNKTDASNYRPISSTSIVRKLFKFISIDHIVQFLLLMIYLEASNTVLLSIDKQFYNCQK